MTIPADSAWGTSCHRQSITHLSASSSLRPGRFCPESTLQNFPPSSAVTRIMSRVTSTSLARSAGSGFVKSGELQNMGSSIPREFASFRTLRSSALSRESRNLG